MIKLGEIQELEVVKEMDFGIYLKDSEDESGEKVLLPIKQVPEGTKIGDKLSVFIYRDSNDRIISTVNRPKIVIGEIGYLRVVQLTKIGAFLNWGLEKDLFLPYKEQIGELKNNGEYMVGLYVDKSNRLCATMNLFKVLTTESPYNVNDMVKGVVFSLKRGLGAMVAVDGKYLGLIHEGEIFKPLQSGDEVEVRISKIKEDGKLDLSLKDAPKLQIDRDGDRIFNALAKNKGKLPLNDYSDPNLIKEMLGMSKSSFKKGVGRLMKRGIIEITREGIMLVDNRKEKVELDDSNHKLSRNATGKDRFHNKNVDLTNVKDKENKENKENKTGYREQKGYKEQTGYRDGYKGKTGYRDNKSKTNSNNTKRK